MNIQSGRHNLVIVSFHFEPELTLRHLRGRLRLIHPHWLAYPDEVGIILGDFNFCDPEEGRFNVWNQTFTEGDPGKTAVHVLEIVQSDCTRRDSKALGIIRTLSRIDRSFINLPMAEARYFHCFSHVFENLGNRTIASDHATVRLIIHKPKIEDTRANVFPAGCLNIPFSVPCCSSFTTTTVSLMIRLVLSQNSKFFLKKAKKQTVRELSRKSPDSTGAKLLIASTALRTYRNRHLGTLMRCCEAWKPIENCFDPISFECDDFQRHSQIVANLTRENLAEPEAEITNLLGRRQKKDAALARCRGGQRAWRNKKPVLSLSAVTDEEGHPLEDEDESGRKLCEYW